MMCPPLLNVFVKGEIEEGSFEGGFVMVFVFVSIFVFVFVFFGQVITCPGHLGEG